MPGETTLARLQERRARVRSHLRRAGFEMHKDGEAEGLPEALGAQITPGHHWLLPLMPKLRLLVAATEWALGVEVWSEGELARLLGHW
eukprot:6884945-Alexandrium_andersonii.AAC.1